MLDIATGLQYRQVQSSVTGTLGSMHEGHTMANLVDALPLWLLQLHLVIERLLLKEAADVLGAVQEEFVQKLIL